ncbi:MAG: corrinoid protein [bacterium]|nr:corrinoid protein [bacterium]
MADYALMNQLLYTGKAAEVKKAVEDCLKEGRPVQEVLENGLIAGMAVIGEDFKNNVIYVPEVLIAARAMKAGMDVLRPLLTESGIKKTGTLVIGTVKGDLHDIGKNLVAMMAEGAGFTVVDLGVDTSVEKFLAAAREHDADIVGMSALLTTTMVNMKHVVDRFTAEGLKRVKIVCGGAPVTQSFADEIGADGYAPNAVAAVELFKSLVVG